VSQSCVALFGTSADPPTGDRGHRGIVRWLTETPLDELGGIPDEVWVLPVYRHAFVEKRDMAPFEDRMAMARLAFGDLPRVRVSDVERSVAEGAGGEVGAVDVVEHLIAHNPGVRFAWVMGADTHQDFRSGRWKGGSRLAELVPLVVVARPNEGSGHRVEGLGPVSSSMARQGRDGVVPDPVRTYMQLRDLYGRRD
jgi:nicotinate-nucleotide adenylyltransferase